jgi:hypothetical protein
LAGRKAGKFRSPLGAQFWLEWRRQGLKLPVITGLSVLFFVLIDVGMRLALSKTVWDATAVGEFFTPIVLGGVMLVPLVSSLCMGEMMASFDPATPNNQMPLFMAVRPMANGSFVLAKLAMSAVSSLLTWVVAAGTVLVWLLAVSDVKLISRLSTITGPSPAALVLALLGGFALAVLLTLRNLVSGIWLGLTGRPQIYVAVGCLKAPFYFAVGVLSSQANNSPALRAALFHWAPWVLGAALALKLIISGAAFHWGLRRKMITGGVAAWMAGCWCACGLLAALLAYSVCARLHLPGVWFSLTLAGLCLLPLAQLAVAPMSLAWNRHR